MSQPLELEEILRALSEAGIEFVVIGGVAVNAHGVIRGTKDLDICPSPTPENLRRLAAFLARLPVRQLGAEEDGGFASEEMPFDPTDPDDLAQGGNFRLETSFGVLDLMQWIPGIDAEHAYADLARSAVVARPFGLEVRVCSLANLITMKRSAGRPQDLADLENLRLAHPDA